MKRSFAVLMLLVALTMIISACQPVVQTVEVEKKVVETQVVEKIVEVEKEAEVAGSFTTPHPILSDLRVRQAMAYCTNKEEIIQAVYPFLAEEDRSKLVMNTMMPRDHWAYAGDENITIYPFDPEKGMALLEEAGWTDPEGTGMRTNADGEMLSMELVMTEAAHRKIWGPVWQQQMAACGFRIALNHVPSAWLYGDTTGLNHREYELAGYAWVGQADPSGRTLYDCNQIPFPENGWEGQNTMGWCNETASQAVVKATNTLNQADRVEPYTILQQEFTKDMVSLPIYNHLEIFAANPNLQGFNPLVGDEYMTYNIAEWEIPGKDTIVLGFTQEPASMWNLVESGHSAVIADTLVHGMAFSTGSYDFQPIAQVEPSTLDSGLATNTEIEVKEGDMVYDINGSPVALAAGVEVYNSAGEKVAFDGTPIKMMQLKVRYNFRDDMVWSDGTPVTAADFELRFKVDCDPTSGATSYATCQSVQEFKADDAGYNVTYLPGVQDPLYFRALQDPRLSNVYPAHRVLSDGRKLADVPPAEWATLPEIAQYPIGVGPYVLKEWVKGEKMVFEANPYYYGGEPKTKYIVISIVSPENAEAQLLAGQIDVLDSTTMNTISDIMQQGEKDGKVKIYTLPGGTWEHIDTNLFLP